MSAAESQEFIEVHWTSASLDEARRIARFLVQERLVACAQIVPWIESVYLWDNQLETNQESKIILKSCKNHYDKIKEIIEKNCHYEVPEISWFKIDGVNPDYARWMEESMSMFGQEK